MRSESINTKANPYIDPEYSAIQEPAKKITTDSINYAKISSITLPKISEMDFTKILDWLKSNWIISILIGFVVLLVIGGGKVTRIFSPTRRRRVRRRPQTAVRRVTRRRTRTTPRRRTNRKPIPRSVGTRRRGYPAAGGGSIPFKYNKDGTVKKAAFVSGTLAAKRRMAQLRKKR